MLNFVNDALNTITFDFRDVNATSLFQLKYSATKRGNIWNMNMESQYLGTRFL